MTGYNEKFHRLQSERELKRHQVRVLLRPRRCACGHRSTQVHASGVCWHCALQSLIEARRAQQC